VTCEHIFVRNPLIRLLPPRRHPAKLAVNEKDSIGSARERGFPATAPHLGVSTADRMH